MFVSINRLSLGSKGLKLPMARFSREFRMSEQFQAPSLDRVTSTFLEGAHKAGPNVWAEAGTTIEVAHRTQLPLGWTQWSLIVVILAAIASAWAW